MKTLLIIGAIILLIVLYNIPNMLEFRERRKAQRIIEGGTCPVCGGQLERAEEARSRGGGPLFGTLGWTHEEWHCSKCKAVVPGSKKDYDPWWA